MDQEIIELNHEECVVWDYADRQEFEMGNLEALAEDIKKNGQIQPIIVREKGNKYEVIAGQRRLKACRMINISVQAVIRNIDDADALSVQRSENLKQNISPYSRAVCYGKILKDKKITQAKLAKELKMSEGNLSDLLSFNDISDRIWESIEDVSKVSVRTALHIRKIIAEDSGNIEKLLKISLQLRKGVGKKKIDEILQRSINFKEENTIRDIHNNKIITIKNREIKFHEHFDKYSSIDQISEHIMNYLNSIMASSK